MPPEGLTGPVEPAFGLGTVEQPSSGRGAGGAAKQIGAAVAEEPARRGGQAISQIDNSPFAARTEAAITTASLGTIGKTASSAQAPRTAR
jgi:hypothetical protein